MMGVQRFHSEAKLVKVEAIQQTVLGCDLSNWDELLLKIVSAKSTLPLVLHFKICFRHCTCCIP